MFYVYVLKSEKDGSFYIGQTGDRDKRVAAHNEGRSRWTKSKRPWMLVLLRTLPDSIRGGEARTLFEKFEESR
jgi:putative endonuclease